MRRRPGHPSAVTAWGAGVAVLCGCVALAARSPATPCVLAVTVAVGLIGAVAPVPIVGDTGRPGAWRWLSVVGLGVAAFALGRWLRPPAAPIAFTGVAVTANLLAAVAEELFFRRFAYGWLARWGTAWAIGGAAVLFAVVHVPAYGLGALPIDVAAGLLFGWQRWATGGWSAPAVSHMAANLLQMR